MQKKTNNAIIQDGYNAAKQGIKECPYPIDSFESCLWNTGKINFEKISAKKAPPYLGDGKGMKNPYVYKDASNE